MCAYCASVNTEQMPAGEIHSDITLTEQARMLMHVHICVQVVCTPVPLFVISIPPVLRTGSNATQGFFHSPPVRQSRK